MDHSVSSSKGLSGSPVGSPKSESFVLTDKGIKHLEPSAKRRIVWAQGLTGFGIRITPKGTKSFVYKYDFDGQDRWLTFGQYPKLKLAEALKKYGEALERVEAGEDPAGDNVQANRAIRKSPTVRQLADEYVEKYAKPHKRSWEEDERILNKYVVPVLGAKKASKATRREVIDLLDDMVADGAPVQANRTLAVMRRMFNFAIDRDILRTSPCHRMKPPSPEGTKDRYLTLDEIKAVWLGVETAPVTKQTRQALRLLMLTLQRSSEILGMNKSEINLRDRTWIIPAERAKNKRKHLVPLSDAAMEIVKARLKTAAEDGYLFPGEGRGAHMRNAAISRAVARNIEHFGIPKFTPHDLRRTGSTQLAAFKVPRFDRDRVLNHTDRTIGAVYDVYEYEEEKRAALNLWSNIVLRAAASKGKVDAKKLKGALTYQEYFDA